VDKKIRLAFGKRVRELRTQAGLSQEQLGDRSGLHRTYVGGIERGERNPSLFIIKKIADALGVSLGELFSYDEGTSSKGKTGTPRRKHP
jgi:transcriptional regulator with XRE-family HTH domain